jgi:hypothetical protein
LLGVTYSTIIRANGITHNNDSLYVGIRSVLNPRDFTVYVVIYYVVVVYIDVVMKHGLLFTTMVNHRPVYAATTTTAPLQQFHATAARDPTDTNTMNPNNPPQPALRDLLARSTQPVFSVSAMFRIKAGGGCGACGH